MKMDDFNTPAFPNTAITQAPAVVDNSASQDALSVAARKPVHAPLAAVAPKPAPYVLEYNLKGQPITERHQTIPLALQSIRRLAGLGIVAKTSTDSGKTAVSALRTDGPTLEEFVEHGYPASAYPPAGYAARS